MPKPRTFCVVALACACLGPSLFFTQLRARSLAQSVERIIHVSVTDKSGQHPSGLTPNEFEVEEGGKRANVVGVRPASMPLRVALIVSDAGTGGFQAGAARFIQDLAGRAEFSVVSVIVQPERLLTYSADPAALEKAIASLGPRGRVRSSAQVMEAISEATKDVARPGTRPVIVVMRAGGEAATDLRADDVRKQVQRSGAALYVVSAGGPGVTTTSSATGPGSGTGTGGGGGRGNAGAARAASQYVGSEEQIGAFNLALVLGDGSRESGGRHDQVISTTMVNVFHEIADELLYQYELTYTLPAGVKPSDRVKVSIERKGVTLRAPTRRPL